MAEVLKKKKWCWNLAYRYDKMMVTASRINQPYFKDIVAFSWAKMATKLQLFGIKKS